MRLTPLVAGVFWLHLLGAEAESSTATTAGPKSTVLITKTESPTMVWTTPPGHTSGIQTPYSQKFTALFSEIAEPLSGKIGLGYIKGSYGSERAYPLSTAANANELYSSLSAATGVFNYTGPVVQQLRTDEKGRVVPASWVKIAAIGGDSTWYGPTYSQNSNDLTLPHKTTAVLGTYTGDTELGQGTSAVTTDTVNAANANLNSPTTTSANVASPPASTVSTTSSSPVAAPAVPVTTTTTTGLSPAAPAAITTTTTPVANPAIPTSTSSSPVANPAVLVTTTRTTNTIANPAITTPTSSTPVADPAASTTTSTPAAANPAAANPAAANPVDANLAGGNQAVGGAGAANPPAANP